MTELTNSQKADVFFNAAMEHLTLTRTNMEEWRQLTQLRPITMFGGGSPYICDAIVDALYSKYHNSDLQYVFQDEMKLFGMEQTGFNVWKHIPAEERQEARWFFLMLMVEYLDDPDSETE